MILGWYPQEKSVSKKAVLKAYFLDKGSEIGRSLTESFLSAPVAETDVFCFYCGRCCRDDGDGGDVVVGRGKVPFCRTVYIQILGFSAPQKAPVPCLCSFIESDVGCGCSFFLSEQSITSESDNTIEK